MDPADAPSQLIDLQSVDCSLEVRVLRRNGLGVPGPHDDLEVELSAKAGPFSMATFDILSRGELADWALGLDQLASGATFAWRDSGRTLQLTFAPIVDGVRVTVLDEPGSGAEMSLSIYPETHDWIGEQRRLLRAVEKRFPVKSVEKAPGVWTWLRAE